VLFATLEDETGPSNIIVWPDLFEAQRRILMTSSFLLVEGRLQKASGVVHVVAERVYDLTGILARLSSGAAEEPDAGDRTLRSKRPPSLQPSRDFH
jgi:error-prone DNA polymerase